MLRVVVVGVVVVGVVVVVVVVAVLVQTNGPLVNCGTSHVNPLEQHTPFSVEQSPPSAIHCWHLLVESPASKHFKSVQHSDSATHSEPSIEHSGSLGAGVKFSAARVCLDLTTLSFLPDSRKLTVA